MLKRRKYMVHIFRENDGQSLSWCRLLSEKYKDAVAEVKADPAMSKMSWAISSMSPTTKVPFIKFGHIAANWRAYCQATARWSAIMTRTRTGNGTYRG